jgi:hypothetical protein
VQSYSTVLKMVLPTMRPTIQEKEQAILELRTTHQRKC